MIQKDSKKDYIFVDGNDMELSVVRTDDKAEQTPYPTSNHRKQKSWRWLIVLFMVLTTFLMVLAGYFYYQLHIAIGVPISRTPKENIVLLEKMMNSQQQSAPGVVMTSDSVLGVALDFYKLEGLHGTLQMNKPDTTDTSAYMCVRASDYLADGTMIGATVVNGKELPSANYRRNGYVAMVGNGTVIGVSRNNKVKEFVQDKGGSFFRQFILVTNGVLPHSFYLHGKVERRAIGRIGNTLYIICTRHKETMWDFADALREYGFVDAIYITGGDDRTFYRTADGKVHFIGSESINGSNLPWLVFKK